MLLINNNNIYLIIKLEISNFSKIEFSSKSK